VGTAIARLRKTQRFIESTEVPENEARFPALQQA
jgi:hypothetical protein